MGGPPSWGCFRWFLVIRVPVEKLPPNRPNGIQESPEGQETESGPSETRSQRSRPLNYATRKLILDLNDSGYTVSAIAQTLRIHRAKINQFIGRYRTTMAYEGRPGRNRMTEEIRQEVLKWAEEQCSVTIAELIRRVYNQFQVKVTRADVTKVLQRLTYSFEVLELYPEAPSTRTTAFDRVDYAIRLTNLVREAPRAKIIYVDEASYKVVLRDGRRSMAHRIRNVSVIAALAPEGMMYYKHAERLVDSTMLVDFLVNLKQTLRSLNFEQALIVLDNAALHKVPAVQEVFQTGPDRLIYLAPHSPKLHPVQQLLADMKTLCQRANPQNEGELMHSITTAWRYVTQADLQRVWDPMRNLLAVEHRPQNYAFIFDE